MYKNLISINCCIHRTIKKYLKKIYLEYLELLSR